METFNFEFYTVTHMYAQGNAVQLGKGYAYGVKPIDPEPRTLTLKFQGLFYFRSPSDYSIDQTTQPTRNIMKLDQFYRTHKMWKRFILPHELFGNLNVRFSKPFQMPEARAGGSGLTMDFQLEMIEQPS